ncbi:MAG TPA: GntR family transcriptional regulator [Stellaceae bacterium]|nr:GntR family transcriptional regulator [Stellaceae bacterium]
MRTSTALPRLAVQPDLVERAYEAILDSICDGTLPGGTRLTQEELAERLDVSRQPVMQALLLLKRQGFVCDAGRRGVMVAPLEPAQVLHLYAIREALDGLAARGAARRAGEAKRRGPAIIAAGRRAARSGAIAALVAADREFHQLIYELSGNPLIADTLAFHWDHIRRIMGAVLRRDGAGESVWDEHEAILDAVIAGDGERAERLSRDHARISAGALTAALETGTAVPRSPMAEDKVLRRTQ